MKIYISLIFLLSTLFAQISADQIRNLTNQQLDQVKSELQSNTKGAIVQSAKPRSNSGPVNITSTAVSLMTGDFFGYNYFKKNISFFDNIPSPANYRLGPGDEIIISLWGENNSRENRTINKDGLIYYNNIGFINLSNKNLESAELLLTEELSRIYSTLKDKENPTKLMLELGKLKSINIYFSGHVENPGINLVHPFSDIFTAIVQAGGIEEDGTLREIQLIRNGEVIDTVDFYSFFLNGKKDFSKIKLIDGDVIHVPTIKRRVSISGGVIKPSAYELLTNDTFEDLLNYASGISNTASSDIIVRKIIPIEERISDDNGFTTLSTNFEKIKSINLNNGDSVDILQIPNVLSSVDVFGQVKNAGRYPANNMSLKDVLDIAGGFDDPVFRKSIRDDITILRKDQNDFYSQEIIVLYEDAEAFKLSVGDQILVYENIKYNNLYKYTIGGQINKPGTYPLNSNDITINKALELAGGMTELANPRNIIYRKEYQESNGQGGIQTSFQIVNDVSKDFIIDSNASITILPYENVVNIVGNVYNPGLVSYSKKQNYKKYIELAGGFKDDTHKRKIYIKRANGTIEKPQGFFKTKGKIIFPGDTIFVPLKKEKDKRFDVAGFTADIITALTNLVAIAAILSNNN
ncbi:SLBB domain-containing protein [Candidatus Marinimicrobia bacterium]|nr:SLBB domain-containing protein [Candidatus Neomarinimicrobiota bacterium]